MQNAIASEGSCCRQDTARETNPQLPDVLRVKVVYVVNVQPAVCGCECVLRTVAVVAMGARPADFACGAKRGIEGRYWKETLTACKILENTG
jgi:hypothetical protein